MGYGNDRRVMTSGGKEQPTFKRTNKREETIENEKNLGGRALVLIFSFVPGIDLVAV